MILSGRASQGAGVKQLGFPAISGAMCGARAGTETVAAGRISTRPLARIFQAAAGHRGVVVLNRCGTCSRRSNGSGRSSRSSRTQNLIRLSVLESLGFSACIPSTLHVLLHLNVFCKEGKLRHRCPDVA